MSSSDSDAADTDADADADADADECFPCAVVVAHGAARLRVGLASSHSAACRRPQWSLCDRDGAAPALAEAGELARAAQQLDAVPRFSSRLLRSEAPFVGAVRGATPFAAANEARAHELHSAHGLHALLTGSFAGVGDDMYSRARPEPVFRAPHGDVDNWAALSALYRQAVFSGLRVAPDQHDAVVVAESVFAAPAQREHVGEVLFEALRARAVCVAPQPVLALLAAGCATGVCVDVGQSGTRVVPVLDGRVLLDVARDASSATIGGAAATHAFCELVARDTGVRLSSRGEIELSAACKQQVARVRPTRASARSALHAAGAWGTLSAPSSARTPQPLPDLEPAGFLLPDDTLLQLTSAHHLCLERALWPSACGFAGELGVADLVARALADPRLPDAERLRAAPLVLEGGTTTAVGFAPRLASDLSELDVGAPLLAPAHRANGAWLGAALLASLPAFPALCVSAAEYAERGASALRTRCFDVLTG